jgi:hypothetical protein
MLDNSTSKEKKCGGNQLDSGAQMIKAAIAVIVGLVLVAGEARADEKEKESSVVIELGGGGEWDIRGGAGAYGPNLAMEFEVIEHWLEIETGVAPRFERGGSEVEFELIFKKPFELSESLEFLIGAGPVWVHHAEESPKDSIAGEAIVELVYWPWDNHKVGFFVEPSYSYNFGEGHEKAVGVTAGLHIGID